jgi:signal transduction histidine kinase
MAVAFNEPRRFTPEDREFALTVAGLCAVALDRAQLFDAEKIARTAAENANMAKGEFLATMSHELRTPLNAIGGHVDLLSMEIHGPINTAQRDALQRVKRAQLHLLGLITDLLNFARLERGKLEYRIEPLVIQDIISDIAPMIEPQVASKGLTYEVRLPDEPIEVVVDREKLVQIILNLMSNSVKFTPASGRIMVDIAERSDGTQPIGVVFLRVSDTGIGIPMDKLETIFDPFVQLSQGLAARRDGTGLGLSISRALARAMGGDLRARSVAGTSTTFTVTLPRAQ